MNCIRTNLLAAENNGNENSPQLRPEPDEIIERGEVFYDTEEPLLLQPNTCDTIAELTATDLSITAIVEAQLSIRQQKHEATGTPTRTTDNQPSPRARLDSSPISNHIPMGTSTPTKYQPHAALCTSFLSNFSDSVICRICHEGDGREELVSPCYCAGTVGLLHLSCLEKWLGSSNTTHCEICTFEYVVRRQPRPFMDFLRHPNSPLDRRNMVCDIVCFFILTPLASISAWLCMMGVHHYSQWDSRWEVPGLTCLTIFLLTIYLVWCLVASRYHYKVWCDWRQNNQMIKILLLKTNECHPTSSDGNNNDDQSTSCRPLVTRAPSLPVHNEGRRPSASPSYRGSESDSALTDHSWNRGAMGNAEDSDEFRSIIVQTRKMGQVRLSHSDKMVIVQMTRVDSKETSV